MNKLTILTLSNSPNNKIKSFKDYEYESDAMRTILSNDLTDYYEQKIMKNKLKALNSTKNKSNKRTTTLSSSKINYLSNHSANSPNKNISSSPSSYLSNSPTNFPSNSPTNSMKTSNSKNSSVDNDIYQSHYIIPHWIINSEEWNTIKNIGSNNEISSILQIPVNQRSADQNMILIQWLISVWPIAANMGIKKVGAMLKEFKYASYEENADIVCEGEKGYTFFIIVSGSVVVLKKNIGMVGTLNKGSTFGELALTNHPMNTANSHGDLRTATIRTKDRVEVLSLHKIDYDHFVKDIQLLEKRENYMLLKECKLFAGWPRSKIERLANTAIRKNYNEIGTYIFKQGDEPNHIFFVLEGTVDIVKEVEIVTKNKWPKGTYEWESLVKKAIKQVSINTLEKGSYFGEVAILRDSKRSASAVVSSSKTIVVVLDKLEFLHAFMMISKTQTVTSIEEEARKYKADKEILSQITHIKGGPSSFALSGNKVYFPNIPINPTTRQPTGEYFNNIDDPIDKETDNKLIKSSPLKVLAEQLGTDVEKLTLTRKLSIFPSDSKKNKDTNKINKINSQVEKKVDSPPKRSGSLGDIKQTMKKVIYNVVMNESLLRDTFTSYSSKKIKNTIKEEIINEINNQTNESNKPIISHMKSHKSLKFNDSMNTIQKSDPNIPVYIFFKKGLVYETNSNNIPDQLSNYLNQQQQIAYLNKTNDFVDIENGKDVDILIDQLKDKQLENQTDKDRYFDNDANTADGTVDNSIISKATNTIHLPQLQTNYPQLQLPELFLNISPTVEPYSIGSSPNNINSALETGRLSQAVTPKRDVLQSIFSKKYNVTPKNLLNKSKLTYQDVMIDTNN